MRLFLVQCGGCDIAFDLLIPNTGRSGLVPIPIPALVAQTPAGTYLIDTGMPDFLIDRTGSVAEGAEIFPHMSAGDAIMSRLQSLGMSEDDVTCVVNTHLHFDHAGGNAHFTRRPILLQEAELEAARQGNGPGWPGWDAPGVTYDTICGDHRLCDGIDLIFTPGHTPGHQSVVITLDDGQRLLFTGDAVYTKANWDEDALGAMLNPEAGRASVARLRDEAQRPNTTVIFGHDQEQWRTLLQAPAHYGVDVAFGTQATDPGSTTRVALQ